jgi:60S ribosome subunit biogenesis protein NIP7
MRPLTEEETKALFEKLAKFIGRAVQNLINRSDAPYCFRLHKAMVYYVSEDILRKATNVSSESLISLGTCFGKFTKSRKFRLHITSLDCIAPFAKYKVWLKPTSELSFLYGNHVLKAGLGRITEDCPKYQGVVVYNMADIPLGFGVTARSTTETRKLEPTGIVAFHQADIGEYLRDEKTLF